MDENKTEQKSDIGKPYKAIPEADMEEEPVSRPKSLTKLLSGGESDGADEKMLPDEDTKISHKSDINLKDVKILSEKNGDAKLDIGEPVLSFGGMNKEELMKYANDPFWVRLRWFLFITFWVLWAAMLVGAVLIIYAAPKCDPPPPRTWWQEGPLTEVKPDTNPEQLKSLNKHIKGIIVSWRGDVYEQFDESHDVIKLIKQAKDLGTKTIIELDPSTSDVWFEKSENSTAKYHDYYIWRASKGTGSDGMPEPPNNWMDKNNKSSWKYSSNRKQFYYAPLDKKQLNFNNASVIDEFSVVIKKFFDQGAAGIRIRNAPILLVDGKFEDESPNPVSVGTFHNTQYGFYLHSKTENLPALGKLLSDWKKVVRNKTVDGPLMVTEELEKVQSYQVNDSLVVDLPVKTHSFDKANVSDIVNNLNHTFNVDNIKWPLWKINSSVLPSDVVDIVTYLLPGAPLVAENATIDTQLLQIRESPSVMRGICSLHSINNNTVFAFIRVTSGNPGVLVGLNIRDEKVTVNFQAEVPALSEIREVTIQHYSKNFVEAEYMTIGAKKDATAVPISPKSVIVLSYVPKKKE
ncbi:hypothetical protein JTB14_030127 [Gonioctena quinquepunctata]|nr:hypothetical protein JTB14_030127 [Gonioctena quinquepunctata]